MSRSAVRHGLDELLAKYPDRDVFSVDWTLTHSLRVYEVNEEGRRTSDRPYRQWDLPAGPWCLVTFLDDDGYEEFAIWKTTGAVYRVGDDGAVEGGPIIPGVIR